MTFLSDFYSPSQGPCCTPQCTFKGTSEACRPESECALKGTCNGATALCPASEPKANHTSCNSETQVCLDGVCSNHCVCHYTSEVGLSGFLRHQKYALKKQNFNVRGMRSFDDLCPLYDIPRNSFFFYFRLRLAMRTYGVPWGVALKIHSLHTLSDVRC